MNMNLKEMIAALENKKLSSVEIVSGYLKTVSEKNSDLNALLSTSESALEEASLIDDRREKGEDVGSLGGIPVILKDNILVQGWNNTAGSKILENYTSAYDSTVAKRLKAAGAILLGRSNMDEFAMGSSTENSFYGPTKNPWNLDYVPGGSSGGSAAAIAANFAPIAFGSDTGGSVRQPASLCGVSGLKPTYGRVSRYGLMAMASSFDQIGPFARNVEDLAIVMRAVEGRDPKDATSANLPDISIPELGGDIKGLKIGVPKEFFVDGMDDEVRKLVRASIDQLKEAGAEIKEISLPHTQYALATYYIIMPSEASSNLGRYDGVRYGLSETGESLFGSYEKTRADGFGAEVKRRIILGSYVLSAGYYDQYYRQALKVRTLIRQDFEKAFKEVDIIAGPTSPSVAWKLGEKYADPLTMYLSDIYTISANLAGLPGLSVPCGFTNGLPVGLQLMARPFEEELLYHTGITYQSMTDWHTKQPN